MNNTYNKHSYEIRVREGFAYIYVDGKFVFRVKHPQQMTPEAYAQDFINKRYPEAKP